MYIVHILDIFELNGLRIFKHNLILLLLYILLLLRYRIIINFIVNKVN